MPTFVYMTRCDGCGHCVDICPSDIMHIDKTDRRAFNIEPNMCWECYSCVKACPQNAIDVRGYADFAPLGHSVRALREEKKGTISWKIKFRDGREKDFVSPIRTTPWGSIKGPGEYEAPRPEDFARQELAHEPDALKSAYGRNKFGHSCLLARRLVERGVRYVQLYDWGWDIHGTGAGDDIMTALPKKCKDMDRPVTALLKDLKQRGMLNDTLVIWGGEFGRTPMVQGGSDGRDHHPNAFTMWLAGGGIKRGVTLGESDEFGFNVVRDRVHVHDLHATILHLLGIDHERLTYFYSGRNFRLTDVHGKVAHKIIA